MTNSKDNEALLVMDVQAGIVDRLEDKEGYLTKIQAVIDAARKKKLPIIFVVVGFRVGYPEVSANNKSFSSIKDNNPTHMIDPKPAVKVQDNDPVLIKRRVSAFTGSDLEVLLRSLEVNHIVLSGIATSGVVLSTLREAADKDFHITVLKDLCVDFDPEVQKLLIEKVFPRQAVVEDSKRWLKEI